MAVPNGHKHNLDTIIQAAKNNDLAVVECNDIATGKPVYAITAISFQDGEYILTPLAKLFDGNPYEEVSPPQ